VKFGDKKIYARVAKVIREMQASRSERQSTIAECDCGYTGGKRAYKGSDAYIGLHMA
jgi:hypothetical protein